MLTSSNKSWRKIWRIVSDCAVVEDRALNDAHQACLEKLIECFEGWELTIEAVTVVVDPGTQIAVVTMIGSTIVGA